MPKIGDKIVIIANHGGHNYQIGQKYIISSINGMYFGARDPKTGWLGNSLQLGEFKIATDEIDMNFLENEEKEIESEINKYKFILKFLEKNNKDECEDTELTAAYLLDLFESNVPNKRDELVKILNKINNKIKIDSVNYH